MKYYPLVKDNRDNSFAWLSETLPEELRENSWKLMLGIPVKDWFPENVIFDLSVNDGIQLTDFIPSVHQIMVVSERLKDILQATGEDFEFFPVRIRNHKKRIVEKQYYLANLIGSLECVDREKSEFFINHIRKDQIFRFQRLVLDESKIPDGKSIFRLGEQTEQIMVNEPLALKIVKEVKCNGLMFRILESFGAEFRGRED